MKKVSIIILTFLLVFMTGFFSMGNLNASTEEEVREEQLSEEEQGPGEGYELSDREEVREEEAETGMAEEEYQSVDEERYIPDPEVDRL